MKLKRIHIAVLLVGAIFLSATIFSDALWYDEAYSVAIARQSYADIWAIGSLDVHPVFYYWLLHTLFLVFGTNIYIFRLFSIVGAVALAFLGYSHVRRDYGPQAGCIFSLLVCAVPNAVSMAPQIRMYTWLAFFITIALLYALRIAFAVRASTRVPSLWWIVVFVFSLAAAYSHYFGTVAAFVNAALLLGVLLVNRQGGKKEIVRFAVGATVVVGLFVPWLYTAFSQATNVAGGYWITFDFPATVIWIAGFPLLSEALNKQISYGVRGFSGLIIACTMVVAVVVFIVCAMKAYRQRNGKQTKEGLVILWCAVVHFGLIVLVSAISILLGQWILYPRYLYVTLGPMLLLLSVVLSRCNSVKLVTVFLACTCVLGVIEQYRTVNHLYAEGNFQSLDYYEETIGAIAAEQGYAPLVVSNNIYVSAIAAVEFPEQQIVYYGPDGKVAAAFGNTYICVDSLDRALQGYTGKVVYLAEDNQESFAKYIGTESSLKCIGGEEFYRPHGTRRFNVFVCVDRA